MLFLYVVLLLFLGSLANAHTPVVAFLRGREGMTFPKAC